MAMLPELFCVILYVSYVMSFLEGIYCEAAAGTACCTQMLIHRSTKEVLNLHVNIDRCYFVTLNQRNGGTDFYYSFFYKARQTGQKTVRLLSVR